MYIRTVDIESMRLMQRLTLSFERDGAPRMWTVLLGENGLCKTTILQAIGLAASGYVRANQLADVPSLPDRRTPDRKARIEATFSFDAAHHAEREYPGLDPLEAPPDLTSWLEIRPGTTELDGASFYVPQVTLKDGIEDPLREARARNLPRWFVAGYGVSRQLPRPLESERSEEPALSRLMPLFGQGRLIGTGFADLLPEPQAYLEAVREALVDHGLAPELGGIALDGRRGARSAGELVRSHRVVQRAGRGSVEVPTTWLSQGYQATIAWIADLIGQVFWDAGGPVPLAEMTGLVLIDELDMYLHPKWQVELIPKLKEVFPRMQFVATTHSPMVLPGLERDEILILRRDEDGNVVPEEVQETPALMTGSQIYSVFFGLDNLYPNALGEKLRRYGFLTGNPLRTDEEDAEMRALGEELRARGVDPGWEPVERIAEDAS